jgi:hypothetical protein
MSLSSLSQGATSALTVAGPKLGVQHLPASTPSDHADQDPRGQVAAEPFGKAAAW